ncbi:hypothetical protein IT882_13205 [Microbacterium schleiferi]|uniref:Uncharacterized protein n=1 Tax=Microbacterium schleiferi TaxID=69362 RepID=A0A7S8MVW5_9MICO|nr:hypothetical protein [Microbacterium schleiferi]QPE04149.1 hypothetical protein IT882_13205 [Microbacterium schleiferi]
MIVDKAICGRVALSLESLAAAAASGDVTEYAASALTAALVQKAEDECEVHPDDVFVWQSELEGLGGVVVNAVWSPDPGLGVEFWGGPQDGLVAALPRRDGPGGAFPPLRWKMLPEGAIDGPPGTAEGAIGGPPGTAEYARAGIDPARRRFVYRLA